MPERTGIGLLLVPLGDHRWRVTCVFQDRVGELGWEDLCEDLLDLEHLVRFGNKVAPEAGWEVRVATAEVIKGFVTSRSELARRAMSPNAED